MTTTSKLLEQLQMAEASYVYFDGMTYGDQQLLRDRLLNIGANYNSKFSDAQAAEFVKHWKVVDHLPDTTSGFSATLFESLDPKYPGELTPAFRGSENQRLFGILPNWTGSPSIGCGTPH